MSGRLVAFTPAKVTGFSTPVITEHLPSGAISYNPNGAMEIKLPQTGGNFFNGRGGKRTKRTKRSGYTKRTRRIRRLSRKVRRNRRIKTYSAGGKKNKKCQY